VWHRLFAGSACEYTATLGSVNSSSKLTSHSSFAGTGPELKKPGIHLGRNLRPGFLPAVTERRGGISINLTGYLRIISFELSVEPESIIINSKSKPAIAQDSINYGGQLQPAFLWYKHGYAF